MIATVVLALRIVMAVSLYSFLGWALLTLWQELRQQADRLARQKNPRIQLEIKSGVDQISQTLFTETEIVIGRDKNCDVPLTDETVSAHHARIVYHHGQWWLEDINSTNGTYLNREKIIVPTVLVSGDEVKCGDTAFAVQIEAQVELSHTKPLSSGGPS